MLLQTCYSEFGDLYTSTIVNKYKFTEKERDTETSYDYFSHSIDKAKYEVWSLAV